MKIRTRDLTGAALDWAVAQCENHVFSALASSRHHYAPSSNWSQGGPIIRRERISILAPIVRRIGKEQHALPIDYWRAMICTDENEPATHGRGATELIAAMICFVTCKLGDEVDIPEGLL